jgi:hypothetical protein
MQTRQTPVQFTAEVTAGVGSVNPAQRLAKGTIIGSSTQTQKPGIFAPYTRTRMPPEAGFVFVIQRR